MSLVPIGECLKMREKLGIFSPLKAGVRNCILIVPYLGGEEFLSHLLANVRQKVIGCLSSFKCGSAPSSSCVKKRPSCPGDSFSLFVQVSW